ncbi:FkbM family methyltransferase [Halonotius roseus]|uniref:FkbM family methyltransferase n=1 Tax=Halonotius roseus TaxID=2511997 RepID=A0A544QMX8_9EURY|nr:FkbM family methyltransferase [Halonotius roseus]TQQ80278.1 FkbM family methyltransferase [Halonotius roseus]
MIDKLYKFGQRIPNPIAKFGAGVIVKINQLRGNNHFRYNYQGSEFVYVYYDVPTFLKQYDCIDVERGCTGLEGIPLSYFDLSDHDAAFDVGAHFGLYTVILGKLNPDIPIFAFEPNQYNRSVLERNSKVNDFDSSRVSISDTIIAGETGSVTFHEDRSTSGSPRDTITPGQDMEKFTDSVKREGRALSDIFTSKNIKRPFIKIDIEGAENKVIADLLSADLEHFAGIVEIHSSRLENGENAVLDQFDNHNISYDLVKDHPVKPQGYYFKSR